jgi:hemerythrin superfamily protein
MSDTKTAADKKKEEAEKAAKEKEKRANFERVVGKRVSNAIDKIELIAKGANPDAYKFDAADIDKMEAALDTAKRDVIDAYRKALTGKAKVEEKAAFSF